VKILVAGGAGFLGSHLVESLMLDGNHVTVLDNLSTGSLRNLEHLEDKPNFSFILADILNPVEIECDQIYNLACPASPIQYQKNPVNTIKTNLIGASNLLDLADKNKARIFQASTSEVYGDPNVPTQSEEYWGNVNPIGIRSCYDEGKRAAESLFFDFHRQFQTEIKVARIFNTYGPRMDLNDGRVVSNFVMQALRNTPITIYGDGSQTRSFCYVDDLIVGIVKLMNSDSAITGPINLGNPLAFSMMELAEKVIELTDSKSKVIFEPLPQDDPKQRRPDISKAQTLLDWEPSIQLEEGLKKTIKEFSSRI
jgi:UDP-glucuronate decarboxylase